MKYLLTNFCVDVAEKRREVIHIGIERIIIRWANFVGFELIVVRIWLINNRYARKSSVRTSAPLGQTPPWSKFIYYDYKYKYLCWCNYLLLECLLYSKTKLFLKNKTKQLYIYRWRKEWISLHLLRSKTNLLILVNKRNYYTYNIMLKNIYKGV